MPVRDPRPSQEEIARARDRTIPDVIASELGILFCGINPSLYSAATGFHFARPGNRFWPALADAGITEHVLRPEEQEKLRDFGCGVTNVVARATTRADELSREELIAGARRLRAKVRRRRPAVLAVLGVTAYRVAWRRPRARLGAQPERVGDTLVWVLPNPSGLNAHYQRPALARWFRRAREAAGLAAR